MDPLIIRRLEFRALKIRETADAENKVNNIHFATDITETLEKINQVIEKVMVDCDEDEWDGLIDRCNAAKELLYEASRISGSCRNSGERAESTSSITNQSIPEIFKLPPMKLPNFSGNKTDWPTFSSLFEDAMATHPMLTSSQKMQFLSSCLSGEAKKDITFFATQRNAFEQAWETLEAKYNRHEDIVEGLLSQVYDFKQCQNPSELQKLADKCRQARRGLEILGRPCEERDHWWNFIIKKRMDAATRSSWLEQSNPMEIPKTDDLLEFISRKARGNWETPAPTQSWPQQQQKQSQPQQQQQQQKQQNFNRNFAPRSGNANAKKCWECQLDHTMAKCPTYTKATINEKWNLIKKHKLCPNCLNVGHNSGQCALSHCKNCTKKHHTSLHKDNTAASSTPNPTSAVNVVTTQKSAENSVSSVPTISLLGTIVVHVVNNLGRPIKMRAILDTGAQISVLSTAAHAKVRLPLQPSQCNVYGINGQTMSSHSVNCTIVAETDVRIPIKTQVMELKQELYPQVPVDVDKLKHLIGQKKLADPDFATPGPVDIILGLDAYGLIVKSTPTERVDNVFALDTILGWVLFGSLPNAAPIKNATIAKITNEPNIMKFWELEEIPETKFLTSKEEEVEKFVESTTFRLPDGRFSMRIPLKADPPEIGASRHIAVARLMSLEKKFQKNDTFQKMYKEVFDEYFKLGHLEPAPEIPENPLRISYLPHQGVLKQDRASSKLRVVFDGSVKTSNGKSINENQPTGPKLQNDIFDVLLRFRSHPVALTADIEKMYRQIQIQEIDRDLQRVVWRADASSPIKDFRLTTVTFGETVSPYLAIKALHFLAEGCEDSVAKILKNDFYVDDLITGADTIEEVSAIQKKVQRALDSAHLPSHKWASNELDALEHVENEKTCSEMLKFTNSSEDNSHKTLGIMWDPKLDLFSIIVNEKENAIKWTRRLVLSAANGLYDPLGFLAPVTLIPKLIMQSITKDCADWDKPLTPNQEIAWKDFYCDMKVLQNIKIPRCVFPAQTQTFLCGFCDASEKGYAAVVYCVNVDMHGQKTINLLTAKTKVAPLKTVSLPRLELLGALLLCRLVKKCIELLSNKITEVFVYTDSTIVLAWIEGHPSRWTTFVANRVSEIQSTLPAGCWQHVASEDNPADMASRGIAPQALPEATLWWRGPPWLQHKFKSSSVPEQSDIPEKKKSAVLLTTVTSFVSSNFKTLLTKFSSYSRLLRVVAVIITFSKRCKKQCITKVEALKAAEIAVAKWVQMEAFAEEYAALSKGQPVKQSSPLAQLNPIFKEGIIRVGGRLSQAQLSPDRKHPIILPSKSHVTETLIVHIHKEMMHAGPTATLHQVRQKHWILHGQSTIKKVLNKCVVCTKCKAKLAGQIMADLPKNRVTKVHRPFTSCGVDFAGPFTLKTQLSRGSKTYKAYISLFICMATRAIHLEVVSSLTTEGFIAALTRLSSRRGVPWEMNSDNGTNFVGANKEIAKIVLNQNTQEKIAQQGIAWKFNPPAAPHFGGLWEAGVKSVKFHLNRVISGQILTYEEFSTVLCKIEAIVNSRPLMPISDDVESIEALTPAHFLINDSLVAVPENDWSDAKLNTLSRWQLVQRISQDIWKRWSNEYLSRLQQRPKWWLKKPNIHVGTLCIINEPNRHPLQWRLGRVIKLSPGSDEKVRVVTLKTVYGEVQRPIHKLCLLPLDIAEDALPPLPGGRAGAATEDALPPITGGRAGASALHALPPLPGGRAGASSFSSELPPLSGGRAPNALPPIGMGGEAGATIALPPRLGGESGATNALPPISLGREPGATPKNTGLPGPMDGWPGKNTGLPGPMDGWPGRFENMTPSPPSSPSPPSTMSSPDADFSPPPRRSERLAKKRIVCKY